MTVQNAHPPLTPREQACLHDLTAIHQTEGLFATITTEALHLLTGEPYAGSLSTLVQYGLVKRERGTDGLISYRMTERGWAELAGMPPELAVDEEAA